MSRATSHVALVRLLWLEQRDYIANIRAAAQRGDRVAKANLETISVKEHRLQSLADLGAFLKELETQHVDAAE